MCVMHKDAGGETHNTHIYIYIYTYAHNTQHTYFICTRTTHNTHTHTHTQNTQHNITQHATRNTQHTQPIHANLGEIDRLDLVEGLDPGLGVGNRGGRGHVHGAARERVREGSNVQQMTSVLSEWSFFFCFFFGKQLQKKIAKVTKHKEVTNSCNKSTTNTKQQQQQQRNATNNEQQQTTTNVIIFGSLAAVIHMSPTQSMTVQ